MGFFRKRQQRQFEPAEYVDDESPRWFDVMDEDLAAVAAVDLELAERFVDYLDQLPVDAFWEVRHQVRPYVTALAPVIEEYEPTPIDHGAKEFLFIQGWVLARTELEWGHVPADKVTRAAKVAILHLRDRCGLGSPPPLAVQQLIEAGYYAYRHWPPEAPITPPVDELATFIRLGALLSQADRDAQVRRSEQNERGRAWLEERAAQNERRRREWMRRQKPDGPQ